MRTAGLAGAVVVLATALAPAPAHAACPRGWGSTPETGATMSSGVVTAVRAARTACFDRLVVDVTRPVRGGYDVRYVSSVGEEGTGDPVPLRGAADLQVVVRASAYDDRGRSTYSPRDRRELADVRGARTFRQVAWAGTFEGQTTLGLGVRARLPFRVTAVTGPGGRSQLVVDVAHRW